jgi:hypothetical protein
MSDAKPTESEKTDPVKSRVSGVNWNRYVIIAAGSAFGLILNSAVILGVVGGGASSLAGGVASLAPVVILASLVYDRYDPVDLPYLSPFVLFITILAANLISLIVRVFREGGQSDPVMSAAILGIVALMFTPGPFLGTWAVRRWWVDE